MNHYQYINFNNRLFIIKRTFKESELKSDFDTNIMKQWTMSDTLLRKDGVLYCCELVQDAQIIEQ